MFMEEDKVSLFYRECFLKLYRVCVFFFFKGEEFSFSVKYSPFLCLYLCRPSQRRFERNQFGPWFLVHFAELV